MYAGTEKRKCLRCGNTFTHVLGGIVFTMWPKCPKCGSHFTIRRGLIF